MSVEHGVDTGIDAFAVPNTQVLNAYLRLSITFSQIPAQLRDLLASSTYKETTSHHSR